MTASVSRVFARTSSGVPSMSQWCVSIAAVEDDAAAERRLELGRGHVPGVGLERLEPVDPGLDHGRDEREEAAAAVQHDLEAEVVAERGQAGEVGLEEAAEQGLADDRARSACRSRCR